MNDSEKELRAATVEARDYHPNVGVFELTTAGALEILGELDRLRARIAELEGARAKAAEGAAPGLNSVIDDLRKNPADARSFEIEALIDEIDRLRLVTAEQSEKLRCAKISPATIFAVVRGGYEPEDVDSLWMTKAKADARKVELGEDWCVSHAVVGESLNRATAAQSAELSLLRSLVAHIRSLAPNGTRGLGSIALDVFDAVEKFDKWETVVDPRDAELERLRRSVESAICWLEGRKNHGDHWAITEALNNLKRYRAPAAQAEPQDCGDDDKSHRMKVPQEVRERGWQWRPGDSDDTAFAPPFGTIRVCRVCGCLVAGGPTACVRCVRAEEKEKPQDCGDQGFNADGGK